MESQNLQHWTRIGTMNRERGALLRPDVETATRGAMLRAPPDRFMGSLNLQFWTRIGTMNRTGDCNAGFPTGATCRLESRRYGARFMESSVFLSDLLTAHEPLDWSAGLRPGEFRSSG